MDELITALKKRKTNQKKKKTKKPQNFFEKSRPSIDKALLAAEFTISEDSLIVKMFPDVNITVFTYYY